MKKVTPKVQVSAPAKVVKTTPARNTPIPKAISTSAAAVRKEITREMIAKRAYEIFCGGTGSDEMGNWLRAERELKSGL
jgi:hypothetical protein